MLVCFINRYVLIDNGEALVIDVRTERELVEDGVIQGALNIPLKQLKVKLNYAFKNIQGYILCKIIW